MTVKSQEVSQIDFSKYRTTELFDEVMELINVPAKFLSVFGIALLFTLVVVVAIPFVFGTDWLFGKQVSMVVLIPMMVVGLLAGYFGGIALGIAELIRRSLGNMFKIVDISLQVTEHVANDYYSLQTGDKKLPPPGILVQAVYTQVMLPIVETAISEVFGFLGKPILWGYRATLGRLIRFVINRFVPTSFVNQLPGGEELGSGEELTEKISEQLGKIAENKGRIHATLGRTRQKIQSAGWWLKFVIMVPCYVVFVVLFLTLICPALIAFWFFAESSAGYSETSAMLFRSFGSVVSFSAFQTIRRQFF